MQDSSDSQDSREYDKPELKICCYRCAEKKEDKAIQVPEPQRMISILN